MERGQSQVGDTRMGAGRWDKLFLKRTTEIGGHGGHVRWILERSCSLALMLCSEILERTLHNNQTTISFFRSRRSRLPLRFLKLVETRAV